MKRFSTIALLFAVAARLLAQPAPAPAKAAGLTMERIYFKPYIAGTRPNGARVTPDGKIILYQWDRTAENKYKQWLMLSDGGNNHELKDSTIDEIEFAPDGKTIAVTKDGDLFLTDTAFTKFTRLTKTGDNENSLTWSPDGSILAFRSGERIMALQPGKTGITELAASPGKDKSVQLAGLSSDNKRALIIERTRDSVKEYLIPRYTGKEVTTRPLRAGMGQTRIGFAPVDTGKTVWLRLPGSNRYFPGAVELSPDGRSVLIERNGGDRKTREIFVADCDSGKPVRILNEVDPAWVEGGGYDAHWMPDGKHIAYTTEREGWNHIYLVTPDGRQTRQLTKGDWEIHWFSIDPSGTKIYIQANKDDHAQWQLFACDVASGTLTKLSAREGTYDNPVMSKDGSFIVAEYSNLGVPSDLVRIPTNPAVVASAANSAATGGEIELTHSVPAEFKTVQWTIPEVVQFKARDSKMVPAFIYKPAKFDPAKKYPVVVFVHGAGYLQNVFRGWSYYYREYMFHTLLNQLGYVVFEVEYRGSAGLGREFRTDVYMHLGGKDLDDEVDGIDYLNRLGYIDSSRVGIYGGSYGGFMALMGLFRTDRYSCGAALRAVTSWENYYDHNPWYTQARLGIPSEHPEAYKISSPITYADSLKKPLLILHGMVDDNVFFQDAVQLVNTLQKSKKKFELMIYPEEAHSFNQPESWYDEYSRILDFFNRNLHPEAVR